MRLTAITRRHCWLLVHRNRGTFRPPNRSFTVRSTRSTRTCWLF